MNFTSEYAETADDLIRLKTEAYRPVQEKRERIGIVRRFTNMMNMLTPEQAEELGETTEITNHGLSYRAMVQNQTQYQSMVTVTNALVEIVVDTDNPEQDMVTGQLMSEAVNRGAIHHKGKFARFWDKVAGEFVISGGCPVIQSEKYGWLPKLELDMVFPPESSLDPEEIPYAFTAHELTVKDLNELLASGDEDEEVFLDRSALKSLLKRIKENIKVGSVSNTAYEEELTKGTRSRNERQVNIPAWKFYEVKYDDKGEQYVSYTLFVDASHCVDTKKKGKSNAYILAYYDKAFDHAFDWLQYPYVDSEIGGTKNMDTVKGVAEMQFNSAQDMEELLNLIIEGEKIRARPMFKVADQANIDKLAKWDARRSLYAPEGIEEMVLRGSSNGLQGPLAILSQNASAITQTESQGNSGNLRVEALANQQATAVLQTNKLSDASNHLDSILEGVVYRLLSSDTEPGEDGYREIMWIRDRLKSQGIDYKKLAKRKYGRFEYIRVRAKRNIGNGDRQQQLETSQWFMDNITAFSPAVRPLIIKMAVLLRGQDPDFADAVVKVPQAIINAQKVTAENERDTIVWRSDMGQVLPIMPDDIHQDHIPIHMLDMQALIMRNATRPWDKSDMLSFAGLVEHTGLHFTALLENPATNGEAKDFMQDYQNIAQAGQAIAAEMTEQEQQPEMTAKEQLDAQFKTAQLQLQARQQGLKERQQDAIEVDRDRNYAVKSRNQLSKEILEEKKLKQNGQKTKD